MSLPALCFDNINKARRSLKFYLRIENSVPKSCFGRKSSLVSLFYSPWNISRAIDFLLFQGVSNIAAVSLEIGYPTVASVPHSIINGFKNVASVCLEADIDIPEIQSIKEYLADPSKFAVAAAPAAGGKDDKPAEEEQKKEESEESDDDMGFGLFD